MILLGRVVVGLMLLLFGRRLYWLFVAGVGFLTGLEVAPRFFPPGSDVWVLVVAVALAIVGALVAVVATKVAIAVVGFVAGGQVATLLLRGLASQDTVMLAAYLVAGIIGAVLFLTLFDWALILLSALAGAGLLAVSLETPLGLPPSASPVVIIVLAVIGVLVQARIVRPRGPRE